MRSSVRRATSVAIPSHKARRNAADAVWSRRFHRPRWRCCRTAGGEDDLASVRRIIRAVISERGGDQFRLRFGLARRVQFDAPDVNVVYRLRVGQPAPLRRERRAENIGADSVHAFRLPARNRHPPQMPVRLPLYPTLPSIQQISVSGFFQIGDNLEAAFVRNGFEWSNRTSIVLGRHSLQFVGDCGASSRPGQSA